MKTNHAVAAVIASADGDDFWHDVDEQGVKCTEARAVADDVVGKLFEVLFLGLREDEGGEDGLEAVDVRGG